MKKLFFLLCLWPIFCHADPYADFYVNHAGDGASNFNAGSSTGNPVFTFASGNFDLPTTSFTVSGGIDLSNVQVGMYASVYADAETTSTTLVGLIKTVDNTQKNIILYSTSCSQAARAATGTGNTSIRVGGVWLGPEISPSMQFPFNFISSNTTISQIPVRVNGTGISSATVAMTHSRNNIIWRGYRTTIGDCDNLQNDITCKWQITGTTNAINLITVSSSNDEFFNIFFTSNGFTGANTLVNATGPNIFYHSVFGNSRNSNLSLAANGSQAIENEFFDCNKGNTANVGCLTLTTASNVIGNWIHNSTGTNSCGIQVNSANCVIANNIISTCTFGIQFNGAVNTFVNQNTIFGSSESIRYTPTAGVMNNSIITYNLFDKAKNYCLDVVSANQSSNVISDHNFYFNCLNGNTSPQMTNAGRGVETNATTLLTEPLKDPDNGNFNTINSKLWNVANPLFQSDPRYTNGNTTSYRDAGGIQHYSSGVFSVYVQ